MAYGLAEVLGSQKALFALNPFLSLRASPQVVSKLFSSQTCQIVETTVDLRNRRPNVSEAVCDAVCVAEAEKAP